MPRYIDADAIHYVEVGKGVEIALASDIDKIPTLTPDDLRGVGKWIEDRMRIKCSVCGTDFSDEVTCCSNCYRWPWNYCPSCGARMTRAEAEKAMEVSG